MNEKQEMKEQPVENNDVRSNGNDQSPQSALINDCYSFYAPNRSAKDAVGSAQLPPINDPYDFYAPGGKGKDASDTKNGADPAPEQNGQKKPEGKDNQATDETIYKIVPGDTLWGIATHVLQGGATIPPSDKDIAGEVDSIAKRNKIANPDLIYAGETIRLPGHPTDKTPPTADETDYKVVSGDTLWGIASRVLQDGTKKAPSDADIVGEVDTIAKRNKIENPDVIYAGDTIKLPGHAADKPQPADETDYKVAAGDTLWGIASRVLQDGTKETPSNADVVGEVKKIAQRNNIANPDVIYAGQTIHLPKLELSNDDGGSKVPPEKQPMPESPTQPQVPSQPEYPTQPQVPSQPEYPTQPQAPSQPEYPTQPQYPSQPEYSPQPQVPSQPETNSKPWRAGYGDVAPGYYKPTSQPEYDNGGLLPYDGGNKADATGGADSSQTRNDNTGNQTRGADNNQGQNVSPAAVDAVNQDQVTRTSESFESGVEKLVSIGLEDEQSLLTLKKNWLSQEQEKNPLAFMRGAAEIADGLGQVRLEQGSWIVDPNLPATNERVLKGYDLDLGGEATDSLRLAAGELVGAQQYVQGHKGQVLDGQAMDDGYVSQLRDLQSGVESKLNEVYGAHQMDQIFDFLRKDVRDHAGPWQQTLVKMQHKLDALRTTDNRYVAKSARDVALGYLAEADYMSSQGNGEDAKIMFNDARKYLGLSMKKDAGAPDNLSLQKICASLAPGINDSLDSQWKDPFNNPFEIPMPQNNHV